MAVFKLNGPQQQAVDQVEGPVLILAGAGTGKTRVITSRIARMVRGGISPESILAVTFTNKAANEMRERVGGSVRKDVAAKLTVCTFHSLCVRILRASIERLGYKRNFSIYTGSDQLGLVRRIIVKKAGRDEKLDPGLALSLISRAKNRGMPVSDSADSLIAEVFRSYQAELKVLNAVDFDDLLLLAVRVLGDYQEVREQWRCRYRYLLVDEFQDTNRMQLDLVRLLTGPERNICVVGDDDQSIYGWRGAEISNILEFERHFPDPLVIKLEQNYRSTTRILDTANSLIAHNRGRREKKLWSRQRGEQPVRVIAMPGEEQEAQHVVATMREEKMTEDLAWEDFAILFRMNTQSRIFEGEMRRHEIPYRLIGGQSFFDRREVKDLLAYMNVFLNPHDDVNLLRVINTPPRGIGNGTIALATEHSIARHESIYGTLHSMHFLDQLSTRASRAVGAFSELLADCIERAKDTREDHAAMIEELMAATDYISFVKRGCKTDEEGATRELNVNELIDSLRQHRARSSEGLRGFVDEVSLLRDREDDKEEDDSRRGVSLITLHAAKGLEFRRVFLVGLEEGILPHSRSVDEGSRDEERRLLYVGITRAMEQLTMSYCAQRRRWGAMHPCYPSSFLEELDDTHLEITSYEEIASQPATEEIAEDYFARMKTMLGGVEGYELEKG